MFAGMCMFWDRIRLNLGEGSNELLEGPNHIFVQEHKLSVTVIITLEGIEKVKTGQITTKQSEQSRKCLQARGVTYFPSMKNHNASSEAG